MPAVERSPAPPLELVLVNQHGEIERAHASLDEYLDDLEVGAAAGAAIRIVVEELVANAICYAFPAGGRHEIAVNVSIEAEDVVVRIEDDGVPFDPFACELPPAARALAEATIGGRGLRLVRSMTRARSYRRTGDRNVVEVRIARPAPA